MSKNEKWLSFVFVCLASLVMLFAVIWGGVKTKYDRFYVEEIEAFSNEFGVDKNLVYGVVYAESKFYSDAVSSVGAVGLMQIMPSTAEWIAVELKVEYSGSEQLKDPKTNIRFGCFYLAYLFDKFEDEEVVLFCYNAGEGIYLEESKNKQIDDIRKEYTGVDKYIKKVQKAKNMYENLY